jgi:hypothetical protein
MCAGEAYEIAKLHQHELLREAALRGLAREARMNTPSLHARFLLYSGDLLIACGLKLRERYMQKNTPHIDKAVNCVVICAAK